MRTLTSAVNTAVTGPVTAPGYFVEILFSTPLRFSSRGTITWNGNTWLAWDVRPAGLSADSDQSTAAGNITLGNSDFSLGIVVLAQGIVDRAINIWKFYGESPATADPVQVFAGVGAEVTLDPTKGIVTIGLQQAGGRSAYSPRRYITAEQGFSFLPAAGQVIPWNGEIYTLQPAVGNG